MLASEYDADVTCRPAAGILRRTRRPVANYETVDEALHGDLPGNQGSGRGAVLFLN